MGKHVLPDFCHTDGYGMTMGEMEERGNLVAEGMGGSGLRDADGLTGKVGGLHDVLSRFVGVVEDILTPPVHDSLYGLLGEDFAFFGTVDRPPGLYTLAEGIEHRTLLLIEGKSLQDLRLQNGDIGDDAVVSDRLLLAVVVDDGISGRFATGASSGGDGDEFYTSVLVLLVKIELVF